MSKKQIYYSDKYTDEEFEYRHVMLPKQLSKLVPTSHLMSEEEWRGLGVQQSQGWIHYMIHKPVRRRPGLVCDHLLRVMSARAGLLGGVAGDGPGVMERSSDAPPDLQRPDMV
ncbi:hypothetical protein JZ751_013547 [Albula glossodonta]|uniref:Cyclin-dependent kinases regulatory subunit n=1 Tax=Albula glossodonta TaxID=121402 RepID=A0A8T2MN18_9TELE|nr:hypothetical protein JZ751_013547 [Albula glossodonta]